MGEPPSDASGHRARLRRRLFEGGPKALLDHELVEYLLALAIPRRETKAQAKKLIAQFGGIGPLLAADAETLKREGLSEGVVAALKIAEATALRLPETRLEGRPVLSSWEALQDYLQAAMAHSPVEEVRVLFLNAKNMLIANEAMWRGSVDEASMLVREVMKRAMAHGATAIIIVHNHPSGDPTPSQADVKLTRELAEAGRHMKVTVHDHIIVGSQGIEPARFGPYVTLTSGRSDRGARLTAGATRTRRRLVRAERFGPLRQLHGVPVVDLLPRRIRFLAEVQQASDCDPPSVAGLVVDAADILADDAEKYGVDA
jgi:DNA repair protein RadC